MYIYIYIYDIYEKTVLYQNVKLSLQVVELSKPSRYQQVTTIIYFRIDFMCVSVWVYVNANTCVYTCVYWYVLL